MTVRLLRLLSFRAAYYCGCSAREKRVPLSLFGQLFRADETRLRGGAAALKKKGETMLSEPSVNKGEAEFGFAIRMMSCPTCRKFVQTMLPAVPPYFYTVPASSTGKYHPRYTLGSGGLLRHTKAAIKFD